MEFYLLLVSEVLDHDAQAANMLINEVIGIVRSHPKVDWSAVGLLWVVSDCGPHFRSYENVAHFCVTMVLSLKIKVQLMYLGEQHGKGACDRLFGWTNRWVEQYVQSKPIHGLSDLVSAYTEGGKKMMASDPQGPLFHVAKFEPGQFRPTVRKSFVCNSLKITQTYSLSAEPSTYAASGVVIRNNVFSDLVSADTLHPWRIAEVKATEKEAWRRGYYDKPRSWEQVGPEAGDINAITRKHTAQASFTTESLPTPKRSFEETLSAKAQALSRKAAKSRRQSHALKAANASSSSSDSSSSSESSAS